jgi:hypothetical protein
MTRTTSGKYGPSEAELVPGAAVAVTAIGLQKANEASPGAPTADAATVNTASDKP